MFLHLIQHNTIMSDTQEQEYPYPAFDETTNQWVIVRLWKGKEYYFIPNDFEKEQIEIMIRENKGK